MMLIGCDFHPSWQQVSWLDVETGETGEQKLVHAGGEAKQFYEQLAAEEKGYVRVPFWSCLEYLTAVAKISGEKNDLELATKVMNVVRSVAKWRDGDGHPRENLHT